MVHDCELSFQKNTVVLDSELVRVSSTPNATLCHSFGPENKDKNMKNRFSLCQKKTIIIHETETQAQPET